MAKKPSRGRQQKRDTDPRKLERSREEASKELSVELPKKKEEKSIPRGNTPTYRESDR